MLSVKDLVKVYKTKGGAEVRALDGVTLDFPDKGMVFLLGKSGSGKSTLLNVAGGLDRPDKGEIIVKGKSSKDFSASDFDSYRNTFIGFVFQEYNILNEFNVEQNISLALQLQNKKNDRAAVNALLEKVDLKGMGKRKPNTLSGGQKQRVAIARALIKEPEIIMADEPTGALDSNTGKQVFETLKKLSAEKLVIVVSHDREFAEQYGDRIIELKDGKVISDTSKELAPPSAISANVSVIGDDTIRIKDWNSLTDTDLARINTALKGKSREIIISADAADVAAFKRIGKISDDGSKEHFVATDTSKVEHTEYDGKKTKFIKSTMPLSRAVKMGASGLKTKPIRLFFTILLSVVSFTLFGVLSAMMLFDPIFSIADAMQTSPYRSVVLGKNYDAVERSVTYDGTGNEVNSYEYERTLGTLFGESELSELNGNSEGLKFAGIFDYSDPKYSGENSFDITMSLGSNPDSDYYSLGGFYGFTDCGGEYMSSNGFDLVEGEYPTEDDEIAISKYIADMFVEYGYRPLSQDGGYGQTEELNAAADMVGNTIAIRTNNGSTELFEVTAVYDTHVPADYDQLKEDGQGGVPMTDIEREQLMKEFKDVMASSFHMLCYVSDGFYAAHKRAFSYDYYSDDYQSAYGTRFSTHFPDYEVDEYEQAQYYSVEYVNANRDDFTLLDRNGDIITGDVELGEKETYVSVAVIGGAANNLYHTSKYFSEYEDENGTLIEDPLNGYTSVSVYDNGFYVDLTPENGAQMVVFEETPGYTYVPGGMGYVNEDGMYSSDLTNEYSEAYADTYYVDADGRVVLDSPGEEYVARQENGYYLDGEGNIIVSLPDNADPSDYEYVYENCYIYPDDSVSTELREGYYYAGGGTYYVSNSDPSLMVNDMYSGWTYLDGRYYLGADGNTFLTMPNGYEYRDCFYSDGETCSVKDSFGNGFVYNGFHYNDDRTKWSLEWTEECPNSSSGFWLNENGDVSPVKKDGYSYVNEFYYNYADDSVIMANEYYYYWVNDATGETSCDPLNGLRLVFEGTRYYYEVNTEFAAAYDAYNNNNYTVDDLTVLLECIENDWSEWCGEFYDEGYDPVPSEVYAKNSRGESETLSVAGFYMKSGSNIYDSVFILNGAFVESFQVIPSDMYIYENQIITDYVAPDDEKYNYVITMTDNTEAQVRYMLEDRQNGVVHYSMTNELYQSASYTTSMLETFKIAFLIAGLVLAVFSALMLFNFISTSISSKRKEIGILRAVGARGVDVFKIFFSEALIIALICFVLAAVCTGVTCMIMNGFLVLSFVALNVLDFGLINIALIFGIAIVVSFLATILPVFFAARKSPVESIRSL